MLKKVDFSEYDKGFRHLQVNAVEMIQNDRTRTRECRKVDAVFFNREEPDFRGYLKSNTARKEEENPTIFSGNVIVTNTRDDKLLTEELIYSGKNQQYESKVPVRIEKPGLRIQADAMESQPQLDNGRLSGHVRIEIFDLEKVRTSQASAPRVLPPASERELTLVFSPRFDPRFFREAKSLPASSAPSIEGVASGAILVAGFLAGLPASRISLEELKNVFRISASPRFWIREKALQAFDPIRFFAPRPPRFSAAPRGGSKNPD